jgi:hypothetical protein
VRIWLATPPADLRKSFDALAELVRQHLQHDPRSGQRASPAGAVAAALVWATEERYDPNPPLLFADMVTSPDAKVLARPAPTAEAPPKRRCKPQGRRRLPDHLRRQPRHHELTEAERSCPKCGRLRVEIGVAKSEQLGTHLLRTARFWVCRGDAAHRYCMGTHMVDGTVT